MLLMAGLMLADKTAAVEDETAQPQAPAWPSWKPARVAHARRGAGDSRRRCAKPWPKSPPAPKPWPPGSRNSDAHDRRCRCCWPAAPGRAPRRKPTSPPRYICDRGVEIPARLRQRTASRTVVTSPRTAQIALLRRTRRLGRALWLALGRLKLCLVDQGRHGHAVLEDGRSRQEPAARAATR